MPDSIQNALTFLRNGDKVNGKKLLLEILNDDPENDQAWVLMTAVVETEELQRECLEKALDINPDNRVAKKRLAKLGQPANDTSTPSSIGNAPPSTLSKSSQATIEYLSKRFIIEKFYEVLALDDTPTVPILNPQHFSVNIPVAIFPELSPLHAYFDTILFGGGSQFTIICLKVCRQKNEPPPITQEQLVEIGQFGLHYSGRAQGQTIPVKIQIWELFEREFTPDDAQRLKSLKRIPGLKKVAVVTCGVDLLSKKVVYSSAWFEFMGTPAYVQRLFDEESTFSEKKTVNALIASTNSPMQIMPIVAGIVIGVVLALAMRFIAWSLGWAYYQMFDIGAVFVVTGIAVYVPKFKVHSQMQGVLSAVGFGLVLYGVDILLLGFVPSFLHLVYIIVFASWGYLMGKMVDP